MCSHDSAQQVLTSSSQCTLSRSGNLENRKLNGKISNCGQLNVHFRITRSSRNSIWMATYGGKTADSTDGQGKITETAAEYVKRMMAEAQQV